MHIRTIEARTHGRYLVKPADGPAPSPLLVGFHGYGESAATHLEVLARIPGSEHWLLVAVQGLHRFYRRDSEVVASWMTREDREQAIADNLAYVRLVMDACRREFANGRFFESARGATRITNGALTSPRDGQRV